MKRIAFDLRCLPADGSPGAGIPHATRELFQACSERASLFGVECIGYAGGDADIGGGGKVARLGSSKSHTVFSSRRLLQAVRMDGCHAFFAPTGSIPLSLSLPAFAWVHDVAIFSHPEWFPQSWLRRQLTTRLFLHGLNKAQHIFCVSEDTRRAVAALMSLPEEVMSVTSEGVRVPERVPGFSDRLDQALVFGTVEPRKNITFLVDLWPEVCRRVGRRVQLVIAGSRGWGQVSVKDNGTVQRVIRVSDEERDALFQQSRLVLVPSLHEGFGRVTLEAMAHGTPVVVSRVGGHPEVIGQAGVLLDPRDREAWIVAISKLFLDTSWWQKKQQEGRLRAASFSWEAVAEHILAVIAGK